MAPKSKSKTIPPPSKEETAPLVKKGRKAADPPPEAPPAKKGRNTKKEVVKKEVAKTAMELFGEEIAAKEQERGKKALVLGSLADDEDEEEEDEGEDEGEEEEEGEEGEDDDGDELYEKEATIEELRALPVLFLSEEQMKIVDSCTDEMSLIGRDGPDDTFMLTNTSEAAAAMALIEKTEKKANKSINSSPSTAFSYALGLTMVSIADDFWMVDNDDPTRESSKRACSQSPYST